MSSTFIDYKIGVVGLGFVGLTVATLLAHAGFKVVGIDIDRSKINLIKEKKTPFYEPSLEKYINETIDKTLLVSSNYDLLGETNIVFITVGTPTKPHGEQDIEQVENAVINIGNIWRNSNSYRVIVIKSTVLPGTTRKIIEKLVSTYGYRIGENLGVAVNPEFLREGYAVEDTLRPSRIIVGCDEYRDKNSCTIVSNLWREFYRRININAPIIEMSIEEAELVKYSSNVFLAMKISFANYIANICEQIPNCDAVKVLKATGLDPRIGLNHLNPGLGYGGSCLPKDVKAFISYSHRVKPRQLINETTYCYEPLILESIDKLNNSQPYRALEYLIREYGDLSNKVIGILGLAYKPGTDDIRESVSLKIIEKLLEMNTIVKVHDPKALENARKYFMERIEKGEVKAERSRIVFCNNYLDVIKNSDAVIVTTDWNEYRNIKPDEYLEYMNIPIVVDGRRIYNYREFIKKGVKIYAIGLSNVS